MDQVKTEYIANWTQKQQGSIDKSFCASQVMKKMGSFSGIKNYFKLMGGNRFLWYLMIQKSRFPPQGFISNNKPSGKVNIQKQPSRGVLRKRCSENMQQIYRRMLWKFIEITFRHGCTPVNMQQIFDVASEYATPFDGCFWVFKVNIEVKNWSWENWSLVIS